MKQAGFTLPEVLIGLSVGAVAVLIAGAGVAAALKARAANIEASVAVEDIAATVSLENRLFGRATPVKQPAPPRQPTVVSVRPGQPPLTPPAPAQQKPGYEFEGDASSVSFVAALWGDPGEPGLWHVKLQLTPSPEGVARQHLVIAGHLYQHVVVDGQTLMDPSPGIFSSQPPEDQVLAEGEAAAGARFAYAGRDDKGEIAWTSSWKPEDGWPVLVSLDPDGDGPAPASVVRLPEENAPNVSGAAIRQAAAPVLPQLPGARP